MDQRCIYLDNNATAPIHERVVERMAEYYAAQYANPASTHHAGRVARREMDHLREEIARLLGIGPTTSHHLVFTSGGTESNNLAIRGLAGSMPGRILISAIEHESVIGAADSLVGFGFEVCTLPVSSSGVVDITQLEPLLNEQTRLVSVTLGNNETGVLQPVKEIARICGRYGIPLHTDAVQVVGKLPVDFEELSVDALSFAAHKFHGPRGVGGLAIRSTMNTQPILFGGHQQQGLRPGTEPVTLVGGMLCALEIWSRDHDRQSMRIAHLRDKFEGSLVSRFPDTVINGHQAARLHNTSNLSFRGLDRQMLVMGFDDVGVACSTGAACASGSSEPSHVLKAMGCPENVVNSSIRFSLGATTTDDEVTEAVDRIALVVNKLRKTTQFHQSHVDSPQDG